MPDTDGYGALALALSKAQAAFPAIPREKEVVVKTKTGGQYAFKYAPLDAVFAAVRKPLAANGLAIVQLLDDGELVTMLLHESGARLSGRIALPQPENATVQDLGSAITYLRRYSLQAILGIATEEDDDGNRASGHVATPRRAPDPDPARVDRETGEVQTSWSASVEGKVSAGTAPADVQFRETPEGLLFGFVVEAEGRKRLKVMATGGLAQALQLAKADELKGVWVTAHGLIERVPWKKDGKDMPPYQQMTLARLETPEWTLPAPEALPADEAEELESLAETLPWPTVVTDA